MAWQARSIRQRGRTELCAVNWGAVGRLGRSLCGFTRSARELFGRNACEGQRRKGPAGEGRKARQQTQPAALLRAGPPRADREPGSPDHLPGNHIRGCECLGHCGSMARCQGLRPLSSSLWALSSACPWLPWSLRETSRSQMVQCRPQLWVESA